MGSEKGNVEVFNMQSGMKRNRYLKGHTQRVTFVGLDKLNKTLISAGRDGLVLVFHLPRLSLIIVVGFQNCQN